MVSFLYFQLLILCIQCLIQSSSGSVYYVKPLKSSSDCPSGYPCHTIDYYAHKISHDYFENETNVSMIFLTGSHLLTKSLHISNLHRFEIVANTSLSEDTKTTLQLLYKEEGNSTHKCQWSIMISSVDKVVLHKLEIYGPGDILVFAGKRTVFKNLLFNDSRLIVPSTPGVLAPSITVKSSTFYRTGLAITSNSISIHTVLSIEDVQFLQEPSGQGGLLMICGTGFSSILIDHITIREVNVTHSFRESVASVVNVFCDKSELDSDIYISPYVDDNVTVAIVHTTLNRQHKTGMHFSILPFYVTESKISVKISNCAISGYTHGAILWNSSLFEISDQFCIFATDRVDLNSAEFTIENCEITNNSHSVIAAPSDAKAAALSVSSNQQSTFTLSKSILQKNTDISDIESIVWISKVVNFTIRSSHFLDNIGRAISAFDSELFLSGDVSFVGNSAHYGPGGALYLDSSNIELSISTTLSFIDNFARRGGAIFINDPLGYFYLANNNLSSIDCFCQYQPKNTNIIFINNTAHFGGNQIYGTALKSYCYVNHQNPSKSQSIDTYENTFSFHPPLHSNLSSISSVPTRVCICDTSGQPQCADLSMIFLTNITISPGELFNVSVVLVGADFGTSLGTVYTNLLNSEENTAILDEQFRVQNIVSVDKCTQLQYQIKTNLTKVILCLHPYDTRIHLYGNKEQTNRRIEDYISKGVPPIDLQTTPVYINVTLASCPPGFKPEGNPPSCECTTEVKQVSESCKTENAIGYVTRTGTVWISSFQSGEKYKEKAVIYNKNCLPDFCKSSAVSVNLIDDPDSQCAFNRAGRLCGGCRENYSLAIGSSHCIHCPNNNNLALFVFFAAAGLLLVIFVGALKLTVTEGLFNGIIFYANIVWTYKSLLFPPESSIGMQFLQTFLAWLNLDFGIETCFFQGLNAYWKTWLQFVFPLYIWFISGTIVIYCHYSTRVTKLLRNRAISILATLLCLSYVKLMRTIIDSLGVAVLNVYPENISRIVVWSLDGNLLYGRFPHILLLLAALVALLLLWLPYTAALLFTQWLIKLSNWRIFRWTVTLKPFFDWHYASLKDRHRYWYGVLLLVRGVLLVIFVPTSITAPKVNLLLLSLLAMLLLVYESSMRLYKNMSTRLFNGLCLLNLAILGASVIYTDLIKAKKSTTTVVIFSVSVVFIQFCLLIIWNAWVVVRSLVYKKAQPTQAEANESKHLVLRDRKEENVSHDGFGYRDSILESSIRDTY